MITSLPAFLAALAPALLVLAHVSTHRRWRWLREVFWIAFGLGVVIAFPIAAVEYLVAIPFSGLTDPTLYSGAKALLVAALPEETGKLAVLVFFVLRHEDFRRPIHAIVLSAAISLGFAAFENVLYVAQSADWVATAVARTITALPMHIAAGVTMGYFAAQTIARPLARRRNAVLTLAVPVALHAAYDFPVFVLVGHGVFAGAPLDPGAAPYFLMFAATLGICVASIVAAANSVRTQGLREQRAIVAAREPSLSWPPGHQASETLPGDR